MKDNGNLVKILVATLILTMVVGVMPMRQVKADGNPLIDFITDTIDGDNDELSNLGTLAKKAYEKILSAFKKVGTLSKDVARVVKLYEALDEGAEDYEDKLNEFFVEYNKLGAIKRKLVDFCTGVLGSKDRILASLKRVKTVDMYSIGKISSELTGKLSYDVSNETVVLIDDRGNILPVGIGYTRVDVSNGTNKEVWRVFVKSPILSTKVSVKVGKTVTIPVDVKSNIINVVANNNKVSVSRNGNTLTVKGVKKGTSYIYVGTESGSSVKYKISVSK